MKRIFLLAVFLFPLCSLAQQGTYSLQDLGKYEIYQVRKGETLYSLSRRFQTTVPALLELNPAIVDNKLKTGSTIRVPKAKSKSHQVVEANTYNGIGPKPYLVPVYYIVAKGETLYSIGQKTQNDVEVVKLWNDLKENNIKPGQKLIVGYSENSQTIVGTAREMPRQDIATNVSTKPMDIKTSATNDKQKSATANTARSTTASISTKPIETPKEKPINNSTFSTATNKPVNVYDTNPLDAKLIYVNEKGICTWTRGSSESGSHYALHPTAPIGSTINVKNMMNSKSVQVKVIGRLPNTPENENIAIKISGSAAKELNAIDNKFLAHLSYMGYEKSKAM